MASSSKHLTQDCSTIHEEHWSDRQFFPGQRQHHLSLLLQHKHCGNFLFLFYTLTLPQQQLPTHLYKCGSLLHMTCFVATAVISVWRVATVARRHVWWVLLWLKITIVNIFAVIKFSPVGQQSKLLNASKIWWSKNWWSKISCFTVYCTCTSIQVHKVTIMLHWLWWRTAAAYDTLW